tara:strand:+ start:44 stop:295 length:252 start_codon:yes stop_codon:yes gene_type:complete
MNVSKESTIKKIIDNILIYNLYILIIGAAFLAFSFILSLNGYSSIYRLFQKLWYPIFIPSLSLFFTAILVDSLFNRVNKAENK